MQNIASKLFTDEDSFPTFIKRIAGEYNLLQNENITYYKFYNNFEIEDDPKPNDEESFYKSLINYYTNKIDDDKLKQEYDSFIRNSQNEASSKSTYIQDQIDCLENRLSLLKQVDIGYKEIIDKAVEEVEQYLQTLKDELNEVQLNVKEPIKLEDFRQYKIDTLTKNLNDYIEKSNNNNNAINKAKIDLKNFLSAIESKKDLW